MTTRFAAARQSSFTAYRAALFFGGLFTAFALLPPSAAAQDIGAQDCGVDCQIVTEPDDGSIYVAPPTFPDLVGPNHTGDIAAPVPTPTLPSTDPYVVDTDGDGVPDGYEGVDSDYDGVWDWYEIYVYGTDPYTADHPTRSGGGGGDLEQPNQGDEEDCTYVTPDTCFPRVKPDDDTPE